MIGAPIDDDLSRRIAEATAELQRRFPELSLLVLAAPPGTPIEELPRFLRKTAELLERRQTAKRN